MIPTKICDCLVSKKEMVITGQDLLRVIEAQIDFKTDQLEIRGRKFLLSVYASAACTDSASQVVKWREPDAAGGAFKEARRTEQAAHRMKRMESKRAKRRPLRKDRKSRRPEKVRCHRQNGQSREVSRFYVVHSREERRAKTES